MKVTVEEAIARANEMIADDVHGKVFHMGMEQRSVEDMAVSLVLYSLWEICYKRVEV